MNSEALWVITTFFCPVGHARRLQNFRLFRRHLKAPLLAVELGRPGCYHLEPGDADAVIRLSGDPQIWQKERLLNIAVQHLPPGVEHVAWVDCDVAFDRPDMIAEAQALLEGGKRFVQLFDTLARLPPLEVREVQDLGAIRRATPVCQVRSFASAIRDGDIAALERPRPGDAGDLAGWGAPSPVGHGIAWAGHRRLLQEVGLYDACIIGGGPSAMALASIGRPDVLLSKRPMSDAHREHYLAWAKALADGTVDDVGFVPGNVFHFWHGDAKDRRYQERHLVLKELGFSPSDHLELAENGTWRWARHAGELRAAVGAYFASRREE